MNTFQIADIFGYAAAGIGIITFLPQIIYSWKTKNTKAISFPTLSLITTGSALWIVYGVIMKAIPIIFPNIIYLYLQSFYALSKAKIRLILK